MAATSNGAAILHRMFRAFVFIGIALRASLRAATF
jgi:hypothetical protein